MKKSLKTENGVTQKLYCYVDETGQDTRGKLFIVVAIVVEKERVILAEFLEKIELQSGKGKIKWVNTKKDIIDKYLKMTLTHKLLKNKIYYQIFNETKMYQDLTSLVIAKAINNYIEKQKINQYQTTILIDGLRKTQAHKISKILRDLGIKIRKLRGVRDESESIIRLADVIAGLIRKAENGNNKFIIIRKEMERKDIINNLK